MDVTGSAQDQIREVLDDYLDQADGDNIDTDDLAENIARRLGLLED